MLSTNRIYPKFWVQYIWACQQNSVDPNQMLQNAASDEGLNCLQLDHPAVYRHTNKS